MDRKLCTMYFSPTHTTQKVAATISGTLAECLKTQGNMVDLTAPDARGKGYAFGPEDLLVIGFPVYGGRIPAELADTFLKLQGENTRAVAVAVYGNRDYDDALLEATDLLSQKGFCVIAAGAFIGEHTYSRKLAAGRPDEVDLEKAAAFARRIAEKFLTGDRSGISVKGNRPYKDPMPAAPFRPKTKDSCNGCGLCVQCCPMGIIDGADPAAVGEGCIQCCACVKACPAQAKYFDDEHILKAAAMLEAHFMARKEPECVC